MSKSLGNFISLKQIVDNYGADILRLWCASSDYTKEISISDEIMKRVSDGYRRIRNTARFLMGNLHGFDEKADMLEVNELTLLDQWAVNQAVQLQKEVIQDYENYQFHQIYQKVHHFCSQEMGAFYLDVLKDRLYTAKSDSKARKSAQTAMHHILQAMIRWITPIITYTADEIWTLLGHEKSVLFEQWYELPEVKSSSQWDDNNWQLIQQIKDANSKLLEQMRTKSEIGSSLDASVKIYLKDEMMSKLSSINKELRFVLITSAAEFLPEAEKADSAVECKLETGVVYILAETANGEKCIRCWHKREDVGSHSEHPELCGRCIENIEGDGEQRYYV